MIDSWDQDSRHPANLKDARRGTRPFLAVLEDSEGEELTFVGQFDWVENELGKTVTDVRFWPKYEKFKDDIWSYCENCV